MRIAVGYVILERNQRPILQRFRLEAFLFLLLLVAFRNISSDLGDFLFQTGFKFAAEYVELHFSMLSTESPFYIK